jgi:hypothetical protein
MNRGKGNSYRIFVGKPEEKRPLGIPRRKWMDNIKMVVREIRWGGMDCIYLLSIGNITNQNPIQEEIKRTLNSGNACYRSIQNFVSSRLLSKNIKIRIYKIIILPVVLYGCETWVSAINGGTYE